MSRNFTGQCFVCGEWGHEAADHRECRTGRTEPIDESASHQPQQPAPIYSIPHGQQIGGPLGRISSAPHAFVDNQQQQQQSQEQAVLQMLNATVGGSPFTIVHNVADGGASGLLADFMRRPGIENPSVIYLADQAGREMDNNLARQTRQDMQPMPAIPVLARPGSIEPVDTQGQAGRGVLPGTRDVHSNRAGSGLLGSHRVNKTRAVRGTGQQQRQDTRRGGRGGQHVPLEYEEEEDDPMSGDGSLPIEGQQNTGEGGSGSGCPVHRDESEVLGPADSRGSSEEDIDDADSHGAEAIDTDADRVSVVGNGRPDAVPPQQERPMPSLAPQHGLARRGVMGTNLEARDASFVVEDAFREFPQGTRFNVRITPLQTDDSDPWSTIIRRRR